MSRLYSIFLLFVTVYVNAQFKSATVGINGLTCSACSNATEQSILKLDFVQYVQMDLNSNTAFVKFKENKPVSITSLSEKVYDAGFSVRSMEAVFVFNTFFISDTSRCLNFNNTNYRFLNKVDTLVTGERTLKFVDKKMMEKSEFKPYKNLDGKSCGTLKPDYYVILK